MFFEQHAPSRYGTDPERGGVRLGAADLKGVTILVGANISLANVCTSKYAFSSVAEHC